MPFIQTQHCKINYQWNEQKNGQADAPVLLLSNSLGTNLSMWDDQMPTFTQHFRVLRYDTRGHGASQVLPGDYSIAQVAGDALSLLDALSIERVHFCGLSMGGMVGMWLATQAPKRIQKLALCNTAAHMAPAHLWNERIITVREKGMAPLAPNVLLRWFTPAFLKSNPAACTRIQTMLETTPAQGYAACCAAIRDMDQRNSIAAIEIPTLVVTGAHDPATPPAEGQLIAAQIKGAQLVQLNAAHLSNIEDKAAFNQAVEAFLTK